MFHITKENPSRARIVLGSGSPKNPVPCTGWERASVCAVSRVPSILNNNNNDINKGKPDFRFSKDNPRRGPQVFLYKRETAGIHSTCTRSGKPAHSKRARQAGERCPYHGRCSMCPMNFYTAVSKVQRRSRRKPSPNLHRGCTPAAPAGESPAGHMGEACNLHITRLSARVSTSPHLAGLELLILSLFLGGVPAEPEHELALGACDTSCPS